MSLGLFVSPVWAFFDDNGNPASGWQLYSYAAGTANLLTTYKDPAGATPNTNPIVLNSRGECTIYLQNLLYKFVLADATGAVKWTQDQVAGLGYGGFQSGYLSRSVAGNVDVTLSATEYSSNVIELTGILTGNINVIVPAGIGGYQWAIKNSTTGNFSVTFKTPSGAGIILNRGVVYSLYTEGTNVKFASAQSDQAYAVDTGAANAYAATYPFTVTLYDGLTLRFRAANANTTASTLAVNGLAASPIWSWSLGALIGGEIQQNSDVSVAWNSAVNGGSGAWVITSPFAIGNKQLAPVPNTTGTDTYTVTLGFTSYVDRQPFFVNVINANTLTTPSINCDGLGAVTIVLQDGTAPAAGQVVGPCGFMYDSGTTRMRLLNPKQITTWTQTKQIRFRALVAGTTYTPQSDVSAFLAMVLGSTGGSSAAFGGGVGGPGYTEKYYATPSGSYTYAIGAAGTTSGTAGGTTSFDTLGANLSVTGSGGVTGNTGSAGGVGSGGTINFTGGTGGSGNGTNGGGGGGAASRAGNGGNGGTQTGSGGGGGGGTGGAASGATPGIAATTINASAQSLGTWEVGYRFSAGGSASGATGGSGAPGDELLNLYMQAITINSYPNNNPAGSQPAGFPMGVYSAGRGGSSAAQAGCQGGIIIAEWLK